jgi:hydroxymethylpyrimidine kinase/phosphomethylpyrimidine kinase
MTDESKIQNPKSKICLTIAGLDPSGGAGIIADIKTFTAFGCFATAAVTSLTFQNTVGVFGAIHQTAESVRNQLQPVIEDFQISAVKTGMLPSGEVIEEIADLIRANNLPAPVVDPVVRSTSGFDLIDEDALKVLIEKLFPLARIVTPNIPEAERIAKMKIETEVDVKRAAEIMQSMGAKTVLIKGGHLPISDSDSKKVRIAKDFLFENEKLTVFEADFIKTTATHGTGCALAAAIAANLASRKTLVESVRSAKDFVTNAIRTAPQIGHGHSPINTNGK